MAVDFPIRITADPRPAQAVGKRLGLDLDRLEKEAAQLRRELTSALSQRDRGTGTALRRIEQILGRTEQRAIITDTRISRIGKDVEASGLRRVNDELDRTRKKGLAVGQVLRRAFAGVGIALVVRGFIRLGDQVTNVQNRLRLVTDSTAELASTQAELFEISERTRTSFQGTAEIFSRLAISGDELGVSNQRLLQFTESLNQAIILSGASAQESSQGLIQLSQGLASGALRGDELRSVLEQLPAVADVIATRLGVTRGQLRKLGEQGAITSKIILDAFQDARAELADRFATTVPTVGQAFSVLTTKVTESVGSFNEATGASILLAKGVILLGENITAVSIVVGVFATAVGVRLAVNAVPAAIVALTNLKLATVAAGGAFVAAAGSVFFLANSIQDYNNDVAAMDKATLNVANDFKLLSDEAVALTNTQRKLNTVNRAIAAQAARGVEASEFQIETARRLEEQILRLRDSLLGVTKPQRDAADAARVTTEEQTALAQATARQEKLLQSIKGPGVDYRNLLLDLKVLLDADAISLAEFNRGVTESKAAFEKSTGVQQRGEDPFAKQLRLLKLQNEELTIKANNSGIQQQGLQIELELQRAGVTLTRDQQLALADQLLLRQQLVDQTKAQNEQEAAAAAIGKQNASRVERLKRELDTTSQLQVQAQDLLNLRQEEADLAPIIDERFNQLRIRQLEASTQLGDGFERAFRKIRAEAEDLAAVGENVVGVFANNATDAVLEFARTGQFAFKEFAASILQELLAIITRLLIVQALNAAFGAVGGNAASTGAQLGTQLATNSGRQGGGTVQPGQAPFPVGENGTELFTPSQTGTITPNPADVQQAAPVVNLQAVVVSDPNMVNEVINSGDSDEALVVWAGRNKDRLKQSFS